MGISKENNTNLQQEKSIISVIIPLFNSASTICLSLDSIKKQTKRGYIKEIIVIDDGSSDNSYEIVKNYANTHPELPIILIHQENAGASSARNAGIRYSSGSFIAFLDADDIWAPEKTEIQMQLFFENPHIDFLGCAYSDKPFYIRFKRIVGLYRASLKDILWRSFPCTPSVIMRRSVVNQIGYFDESQKYCEDMNYFQKICLEFEYYYLSQKLVTIGIGKNYQCESGLISNIKEMHQGAVKNLKELYQGRHISRQYYLLMFIFLKLKYVRRSLIVFYTREINKAKKQGSKNA